MALPVPTGGVSDRLIEGTESFAVVAAGGGGWTGGREESDEKKINSYILGTYTDSR